MSTPTDTSPPAVDFADLPNRLSLLPKSDGDFQLVLHVPKYDRWVMIMPLPIGDLPPAARDYLIHLAPIPTDTPDDIVEQFRKQLNGDGGAE